MRKLLLILILILTTNPAYAAIRTAANSAALTTLLTGGTLACGDIIVLFAGTTYTGTFTLPNRGCSGTFITMTSSGVIPTPGTRTSPAFASQMAKIVGDINTGGISVADDADYWYIVGLEITTNYATSLNLVWGGFYTTTEAATPDHIVLDRNWIHGSSTTSNQYVGVALNGSNIQVINNYIENIHSPDFEAECVQTYNGRGPYLLSNNYMSCAGENSMAGGNVPVIHNMVLDGFTVTNNYMTKDCSWFVNAADVGCPQPYIGIHFIVKNVFELKCAKNVTVQHNIFEFSWTDSQTGEIVLMQSANPDFSSVGGPPSNAPLCGVSSVVFRNNIIRHGNKGVVICGNCFTATGMVVVDANSINIQNNLIYDLHPKWGIGGNTPCLQLGLDSNNIIWNHNTCDNFDAGGNNNVAGYINSLASPCGCVYDFTPNLTVKDSLFRGNLYGFYGNGVGSGTAALDRYAPGTYTFLNNVLATDGIIGGYPATTDQPSIATYIAQFRDRSSDSDRFDAIVNYQLVQGSVYAAGGAKQASDATAVGVDMCTSFPAPDGDANTDFVCTGSMASSTGNSILLKLLH